MNKKLLLSLASWHKSHIFNLGDLLYLPPEAAPIQEAINLVKDKPLKAAVSTE
jgi:hypothetical protein